VHFSVYEAALKGLRKLERVGWEGDGPQIGWVTVEVREEPTQHRVHVGKMLGWIKSSGRTPRDEMRKEKWQFNAQPIDMQTTIDVVFSLTK